MEVSWKAVTGAAYYIVEYQSIGGTWIYSNPITATGITISALASATTYSFAVASFCPDNTTSGYSNLISKPTKSCSTPAVVNVTGITSGSSVINWTPLCGSDIFSLQYRKSGTTAWTKINNLTGSSYAITNLESATVYESRVRSECTLANSSWSASVQFTTLTSPSSKKNILLIVLDDARYDAFTPNGAPSWFSTPAINRIANEGVNFKLMIPTTSQCAPSRACIYTGVYPHINGVEKNGDTLKSSFPLIQKILSDEGYYTGFIGKYGQYFGDPKGFNWWATSDGDVYINPNYTINGKDTLINGHISDVYPQLAKTFLNNVPAGKNFALFYFTRIPHDPTIPRTQDAQLYLNDTLPFPSNYPFYTNNYPSFYSDQKWNADSAKVKALKLATYQTLKGTEDNVDSLLDWVQGRDGTLDSTLIIFTSDNGYLMGEHHLHEKILSLEESIRVPLFIRYPKWFGAGTLITDEIASNLDIATTLLDFIAIPNTYGFQGLSLQQLSNGQAQRKSFLYETGWDPYIARLRAVRTLNDIYIRSYCKNATEEFYDLLSDSKNNNNLIFNASWQTTIGQRRTLLDSLRNVYNDNNPKSKNCSLITNGQRISVYNNEETPELEFAISPNPAAGFFSIYFTSHIKSPAVIGITSELGNVLWSNQYSVPLDIMEEIDCSKWSNGFYYIKAVQDGKTYGRKILISQ